MIAGGTISLLCLVFATSSPAELTILDIGPNFRTACRVGELDRVIDLLQKGAPLEGMDNLGRTPLILASHGNPEIVKLLLARGAKVDSTENDGDTPLCIAVEHGQLANAKALLAHGADINHVNHYGRTPLMLAARDGYDEIISYLLAKHADPTAGDPKSPALSYAVWKDHISTAKLLLEAGQRVPVPESVKKSSQEWGTVMLTAVYTGDPVLIDLLLDHGGDINEMDSNGRSAFYSLLQNSNNKALIVHLLERGANPNQPDHHGDTPFMTAVSYADAPIVQVLVQHGANVNAQDAEGRTELMSECGFNNMEKVQELLAFHPDVNLQDKAGETALTYAGNRGGVEIVRLLEQAGATFRPLHVIPDVLRQPLTKPEAWALAVGALYAQYNGFSQESLSQDPERKESLSDGLKADWNITNRDELLVRLRNLESGPAWRTIARNQIEDVAAVRGGVRTKLRELGSLLYLDLKWRGKLNVAWNACREANLIRNAVTIGYLNEQEAWPFLLRNARRVQQTYGSWQEMNDSFLDSREIWAGEKDPDFNACARLLLNPKDPNSPWSQLPWNTDLGK